MGQFDFSKIIKNPSITEISDFVIEPSTFSYKLTGNTLNMSFDYYSFYDCENEKNNVKKSMIIKKELK
jgi:hypothetical protein